MGSFIHLGLGNFEIDWGKNQFFNNHSALFLPGDAKPAPHLYFHGTGRDLSKAMYEPHPEGAAIGKNPFTGNPIELHRVAGLRGRRP
jgi:hypothetical protein